jgi:hypothetical protein
MGAGKNLIGGISKHDYTGQMAPGFSANEYDDEIDEGGGSYSISGEKAGRTLISKEAARQKAIDNGWVDPNISQGDYNKKMDAWYKKKGTTPQEISKRRSDKLSFTQKSANVTNNTNVSKNQNDGNGGGQNQSQTINNNVNTGGKSTTTTTTPPANSSSSNSSNTSSTGYTGNNPNSGQWQKQNVTNNINISGLGGGGGGSTPGGGGGTPGPLADGGGGAIDKLLGRIPKPKATFKKTTGRRNQTTQGGNTPYKFRGLQNQFESWQMNHYDNNDQTT